MAKPTPNPPRSDEAPSSDGRTRRAERSREAIADALFDLVAEEILEPTAQQVADRAGVGLRSVFRHFQDMESLYTTLDARLLEEVLPILSEPPPDAPLGRRARSLAEQRERFFERIAPFKRSSDLRRSRSPFLTEQHLRLVGELREGLIRWLPELEADTPDLLEAADQAASFEAWNRIRTEQGLSRTRAKDTLSAALEAIVARLESPGGD